MKTKYLFGIHMLAATLMVAGCATKTVTINSSPEGVRVLLDRQSGATPLTQKLKFKPRNKIYEAVGQKKGYKEGKIRISFEPKEKKQYTIILERYKKPVRINSTPQGATVFLNGKQMGITPFVQELIFEEPTQQFELTLRKEGYENGKGTITYYPVIKTDYLLELKKIEAVTIELVSVEPTRTEKGVKLEIVRKPTIAYLEVIERSPNVASVTRVTGNEDRGIRIGSPELSPTEDILLFEEFIKQEDGSTFCNIQKQKVGSAAKTRLTYGKYIDLFPAFTPEGKRVVFSSNRASGKTLWIIKADGPGGISRLTNSQAEDYAPSVSPDGGFVVYTSLPPNAEESQIWTVPINATLLTQLREGESPQVSPDGKSILFCRRDKITKMRQLWLMSVEGAGETQLTQNMDFETIDARWSPDGEWIVYASNEGRDSRHLRNYDIWLMAVDGSKHTQLTTNGSWDDGPCWDAKGEYIYFRSNRGDAWNIWRFKPIALVQGNEEEEQPVEMKKEPQAAPLKEQEMDSKILQRTNVQGVIQEEEGAERSDPGLMDSQKESEVVPEEEANDSKPVQDVQQEI